MKISKFFSKYIKDNARKIGLDEFGNTYYEEKNIRKGINKRYVIYRGINEPSKIPAEWNAWLNFSVDAKGDQTGVKKYSWQKIHIPNLTGTIYSGH